MSGIDVQKLAVEFPSIADATRALNEKKIKPEEYTLLLNFKKDDPEFMKGTQVEKTEPKPEDEDVKEARAEANAQANADLQATKDAAAKAEAAREAYKSGDEATLRALAQEGVPVAIAFCKSAGIDFEPKADKQQEGEKAEAAKAQPEGEKAEVAGEKKQSQAMELQSDTPEMKVKSGAKGTKVDITAPKGEAGQEQLANYAKMYTGKTGKRFLRNEFGQSHAEKSLEDNKKELKEFKKQLKAEEKEKNKLLKGVRKNKNDAAYQEVQDNYNSSTESKLAMQYAEKETTVIGEEIAGEIAAGTERGMRVVDKMESLHKKVIKNMQRVHDREILVADKDTKKDVLKANPDIDKNSVKEMNGKDINAVTVFSLHLNNQIQKAKKSYQENPTEENKKALDEIMEKNLPALNAIGSYDKNGRFHLDTLKNKYLKAQHEIANAQKAYDSAPEGEEKELAGKNLEAVKDRNATVISMFDADGDGKVDAGKEGLGGDKMAVTAEGLQTLFAGKTGKDFEANPDEVKVLAQQTGLKEKEVRSILKDTGFAVENKQWERIGVALATAATVGLLSNLFDGKKVAKAEASQEVTKSATVTNTVSKTATGTAEATATATIPGYTIEVWDDDLQRYVSQEIAGQTATETATATASATAVATASATATVTAFAKAACEAVAKVPLLSRLLGPAAAGVATYLTYKPQTQDVFSADVETTLKNLNTVKGDVAKAYVYQIQNMEFRDADGNLVPKEQADAIKVAVMKAGMGEDTKKMNEKELAGIYMNLKDVQANLAKIRVKVKPNEPPAPPVEDNTPPVVDTPPVQEPKKEIGLEERSVIVEIPYIKYGGPWHYSKLYVDENGNPLSEADRKAVQRYLQNNHLSVDTRTKKATLDSEIELPNGKKVKLASDASAKAEKMRGKDAGRRAKRISFVHNKHGEGRVLINGEPAPGAAGQWKPIEQARADFERIKAEQDKK